MQIHVHTLTANNYTLVVVCVLVYLSTWIKFPINFCVLQMAVSVNELKQYIRDVIKTAAASMVAVPSVHYDGITIGNTVKELH